MQAILWPIVSWIFREVIVKFVVLTAIFAVVAFFVPMVVAYLAPFLNLASLNSAFGGIPSGVWWFADHAQIGVGLPLVISAYIARFLIRRLPVIG